MPEWLTYLLIGLFIAGWLGYEWRARRPLDLPGLANQEGRDGAQPGTARQAGEPDLPGSSSMHAAIGHRPGGQSTGAGEPELCSGCLDPDVLMHCDGRSMYCDCTCGWPDDWAEPDETWVEDLPPERPLVLASRPVAIALSDDPDLVVWDARQQWQRCWEILHVDFPRLRAELGIAA